MSLWHHAPVIHADDKSLVANLTEVENAALSKGGPNHANGPTSLLWPIDMEMKREIHLVSQDSGKIGLMKSQKDVAWGSPSRNAQSVIQSEYAPTTTTPHPLYDNSGRTHAVRFKGQAFDSNDLSGDGFAPLKLTGRTISHSMTKASSDALPPSGFDADITGHALVLPKFQPTSINTSGVSHRLQQAQYRVQAKYVEMVVILRLERLQHRAFVAWERQRLSRKHMPPIQREQGTQTQTSPLKSRPRSSPIMAKSPSPSVVTGVGLIIGTHESPAKPGDSTDASPDAIKIQRLIPGKAAALSGLVHVGDELVRVNGQQVQGMPLDVVRDKIKGPGGSKVGLVLARLGPRGLFFSSVDLTRGLGGDSALNTPQQRSPGLSPVASSLAATRDLGIEKHSEGMTFCPSTPPSAGHNELLVSQRGVGESSAAQNELLVSHKLQLERTSAEAAQAQALVIKLSDELACGRAEAAASQALVREMSSRISEMSHKISELEAASAVNQNQLEDQALEHSAHVAHLQRRLVTSDAVVQALRRQLQDIEMTHEQGAESASIDSLEFPVSLDPSTLQCNARESLQTQAVPAVPKLPNPIAQARLLRAKENSVLPQLLLSAVAEESPDEESDKLQREEPRSLDISAPSFNTSAASWPRTLAKGSGELNAGVSAADLEARLMALLPHLGSRDADEEIGVREEAGMTGTVAEAVGGGQRSERVSV